ncbi:MAG TPA: RNA 2',3'-cyclic phosphodiesterase [Candidatus Moranbacteria bacterium]|mgnify:CR=1 FL=1|nr:RNA 2',3'-cyclic phosphodiesterase [Candidatus Moranbacteria bacterium]
MQKKKIFIEIAVPQQIKKRIMQKIAPWADLPIKWVKEESLHITVSFVGYVDESVVPDICFKVKETVAKIESFEITFDRIGLAPDAENPKSIALIGKPLKELGELNEKIEEALDMYPQKHKQFSPHVTLGRIKKLKWDELSKKPLIEEKCNIGMTAEAVLVMESRGGEGSYSVLEQCNLV